MSFLDFPFPVLYSFGHFVNRKLSPALPVQNRDTEGEELFVIWAYGIGMNKKIDIGQFTVEADRTFFFIAGPCVIEDEATTLEVARFVKELSDKLSIPAIFKTSYDKANRTSLESFRGPGIEKGLGIIRKVKERTGLPVLSDIHGIHEIDQAAEVLDVIQIPAFLCRQTDLIVAAAKVRGPRQHQERTVYLAGGSGSCHRQGRPLPETAAF